jgi:regulator of protease activity HflC (stomatin/prohibitin superfamily)
MFRKRIVVKQNERALLFRDGRFHEILSPGEHFLLTASEELLSVEIHDLSDPVFASEWTNYLVEERPDVIALHFIRIETLDTQIAMIYVNGALFTVLVPSKRMLFWRDAADVTAEVVDLADDRAITEMEEPVSTGSWAF